MRAASGQTTAPAVRALLTDGALAGEWVLDPDRSEVILRTLLEGSPCQLQVKGGCMAPVLPPGTRVSLGPAACERPRWGDVVLVRVPAGLRLHRLVWGVSGGLGGLRTKGDQAYPLDPPLRPVAILAKVVEPVEPATLRLPRTLWSLAEGLLHGLRERLRPR